MPEKKGQNRSVSHNAHDKHMSRVTGRVRSSRKQIKIVHLEEQTGNFKGVRRC